VAASETAPALHLLAMVMVLPLGVVLMQVASKQTRPLQSALQLVAVSVSE
jgi:hypothetical protein